jgi:hypothetical protein
MLIPYHCCKSYESLALGIPYELVTIESDGNAWYLRIARYASEEMVSEGEAEYRGELVFSYELLIKHCPFCGAALHASKEMMLERLIDSLQILAADYKTQTKLFPEFVCLPDELVRNYNDCLEFAQQLSDEGLITDWQQTKIEEIAQPFRRLGSIDAENIWTLDALKNYPEWQNVRSLAKEALFNLTQQKQQLNIPWIEQEKSNCSKVVRCDI